MAYCGLGVRLIDPTDHFKGGIKSHATPAVKLVSCNNSLSSVHTACIILRSSSFCIRNEKYYNLRIHARQGCHTRH